MQLLQRWLRELPILSIRMTDSINPRPVADICKLVVQVQAMVRDFSACPKGVLSFDCYLFDTLRLILNSIVNMLSSF